MPSLNRLHRALTNSGFVVLAVSIDSSDKLVRDFIKEKKISFTVLRDREKEVFFDLFAGPSLPASYLLDRKGVIVETFSGPKEWDSSLMERRILSVINQN
jgi:peroxiredoxin